MCFKLQAPTLLILKTSGQFISPWKNMFAEIWLDKILYVTRSSAANRKEQTI